MTILGGGVSIIEGGKLTQVTEGRESKKKHPPNPNHNNNNKRKKKVVRNWSL